MCISQFDSAKRLIMNILTISNKVEKKTFPPVQNGECDGLGCGFNICWCDEHTEMAEEFQRQFQEQWNPETWKASEKQQSFEKGWRFGTKRLMDIINAADCCSIDKAKQTLKK